MPKREVLRAFHVVERRALWVATVCLGSFLLLWLVLRPPFTLASPTVPSGVSVAVVAGSAGAETDGAETWWWISSPNALIGVANNTADVVVVDVIARVTNEPCPVSRAVHFAGHDTVLPPGSSELVSTGPFTLEGYERVTLDLATDGRSCPPNDQDPRELYLKVTELEAAEVAS